MCVCSHTTHTHSTYRRLYRRSSPESPFFFFFHSALSYSTHLFVLLCFVLLYLAVALIFSLKSYESRTITFFFRLLYFIMSMNIVERQDTGFSQARSQSDGPPKSRWRTLKTRISYDWGSVYGCPEYAVNTHTNSVAALIPFWHLAAAGFDVNNSQSSQARPCIYI